MWFVGGRSRLPIELRIMTWTMRHPTQSIDADTQAVINIAVIRGKSHDGMWGWALASAVKKNGGSPILRGERSR